MFRRTRTVRHTLRLDAAVEQVWALLNHPEAAYWQADAEDRYELSQTSSGVTLRLTQRRMILPGTDLQALADAEASGREHTIGWLAEIKALAEATD